MVTHLDVKVGQLYSLVLPDQETPVLAEFKQETRHDTFLFARERTDRPIELDCDVFEKMRNDGTANRITLRGDGRLFRSQDLDPTSLLDPDEPSITLRERDRRLKALEKLHRARTLRFYVSRYDESSVGRGHKAIGLFTKENYPDALELGFYWRPDAATILRSVDRHGVPGSRPLTAFFEEYRQHDRSKRWSADVLKAADEANTYFWSARAVSIGDAIAQFTNDIATLKRRWEEQGHVVTDETFAVPSDETLRTWIREKTDWYHWASKYNKKEADRRFRGRGRIIEATRPLEYVMIDHTMLDAWAVITDDEGEPLFAARAWLTLAIDCYSRMVVGAVIGYERPSVHSAMACLRQVIRSKDALIKEYGYHKGATDGYGRPFTVIVDNGWEFTGKSFQTSCEAAGIDVMWAPVKVPMFKAYVERFFGTLNSMLWHKIPGGIPLTVTQRRTLELEPEADVVYTRTQLESAMWSVIVRRYHLETHSTINMAPARKWHKGIEAHTRPTIDDIAALDKVVGRAEECQLSAEGIFLDGERFHDQKTTTGLLNRLAAHGKERAQREGALSTRTVTVLVFADPGDASKVHVWDPTRKEAIALPNWNRLYCQGLPWHAVRKIRQYAKEQNLAFHSDEERAAARIAHRDYLLSMLPKSKLMQGRKHAQIIEPMPQLASGNVVKEVDVSDEVQGYSVAHDIAAHFTVDLAAAPGRRRGGLKATEKSKETKERKRQEKAKAKSTAQPESKSSEAEPKFETIAAETVVDADDFMAAVRAQLEADSKK